MVFRAKQLHSPPFWAFPNDSPPAYASTAAETSQWFSGALPYLSVLAPLTAFISHSYMFDSVKLFILGALFEMVRRASAWLIGRFRFQLTVTARFYESDHTYDWIIHLLTEENVWRRSCEFDVSAKSSMRKFGLALPGSPSKEHEHADYVPTWSIPQLFRWNGYWVEVSKSEGSSPSQSMTPGTPLPPVGSTATMLTLTVYTLRMSVLSELVEEARARYIEAHKPHVIIHVSEGNHGPGYGWGNTKQKPRRPVDSVVLTEGMMENLLEDVREFLGAEAWYNERGIPFRRGYLLYGPPGTGKTSTIYSLAGELGVEIYSLSLGSGNIDDLGLQYAANACPKNSILLIEDIDCAFPSREDDSDDEESDSDSIHMMRDGRMLPFMGNKRTKSLVTMSGLLNVLDGVGSDEGKIFFATTNYVDRLDPALMRPGRIDRRIEYQLASQVQACNLFLRFYTPSDIPGASVQIEKHPLLEEMAAEFSRSIPENEISTAELQGFLLLHKKNPVAAVKLVTDWVENERRDRVARAEREKVRKEKARTKKDKGASTWGYGPGVGPGPWGMGPHMMPNMASPPVATPPQRVESPVIFATQAVVAEG